MIPLDFDIRPYAKLAAFGALAVSGGAFALWLVTLYVTRPAPGGGIDATHYVLSAMAVGIICAAIIAVHLVSLGSCCGTRRKLRRSNRR